MRRFYDFIAYIIILVILSLALSFGVCLIMTLLTCAEYKTIELAESIDAETEDNLAEEVKAELDTTGNFSLDVYTKMYELTYRVAGASDEEIDTEIAKIIDRYSDNSE